MRVKITIPKSGSPVTIKAVDLVGDAWEDYVYYINKAGKAYASNNLHETNRALRSALVNLIAHLEGVVNGVFLELEKTRSDFKLFRCPDFRCTLKSQISHLRRHAKQQMRSNLPYLRLRLKPLRDILVHPLITKVAYDAGGHQFKLSELDLFELTVPTLRQDGNHISQWLDHLCNVYNYTRVHDTQKTIEDLVAEAKKLGVELTGSPPRRM